MSNQEIFRGPARGYEKSIERLEGELKKLKSHVNNGSHKERREHGIVPENRLFLDVLGEEILVTMNADQYNLLGQTFRPIFCGRVVEVTNGFITLDPVIIKMSNAPFHCFPTPLSFAIEQISNFTPFNCDIQFPIP